MFWGSDEEATDKALYPSVERIVKEEASSQWN